MLQLLEILQEDRVKYIVVANEDHESGEPHLHAVVRANTKFNIVSANTLDLKQGERVFHGNYQAARSEMSWFKYVIKCGDVCERGDTAAIRERVEGQGAACKSDQVAEMIQKGASLDDVERDFPGFYMMSKNKITSYFYEVNTRLQKNKLVPWLPIPLDDLSDEEQVIAVWLNTNMHQPRAPRQKQLYVHGSSGIGKTSIVIELSKFFNVYSMPYEPYFNQWDDKNTDLVILDEFKGQHRLTFMNQFMQGLSCHFRACTHTASHLTRAHRRSTHDHTHQGRPVDEDQQRARDHSQQLLPRAGLHPLLRCVVRRLPRAPRGGVRTGRLLQTRAGDQTPR